MFNWIKNLTKGNKNQTVGPNAEAPKVTRTVRRIVPASQRSAETEEQPPAFTSVTALKSVPTVVLASPIQKPSVPTAIAFPRAEEENEHEVIIPMPAAVRIAAAPIRLNSQESEPEETAEAPKVNLSAGVRKPSIRLNVPDVASNKEIVLTIGDFVGRIPTHFLNESAVKPDQEVRFDAADLYSDMTKGRATVPLSIIAEVIPALFKRRLSAEEDIEIQLPLPKVVSQMGDILTHRHQEQEEAFEEVETPFLKAARQDQKIHKVSGAISLDQIKAASTVSFSPATAGEVIPPQPEPTPTIAGVKSKSSSSSNKATRRVTVRVRPLIQAMAIEQREDLLGLIPEDSKVELPLDQIEDQLPSGRVFLPLATFSAALSPSFREKFKESFVGSEVPISLSEIIKNLPTDSLSLREDQTEQEVDPNEFETPFNTTPDTIEVQPPAPAPKAAAIPKPAPGPQRDKPAVTPAFSNYTTRKLHSVGGKFPSPMHAALGTQESLDAKKIVKLATALPGVASLTIITGDGLSLAGNLPTFMDPEGFSAMAPQLHRKIASHVNDMKLGELKHLSLTTENHAVTIFTCNEMAIAVLHQNQSDLGHGVREKFMAIVDGLAEQYKHQPVSA